MTAVFADETMENIKASAKTVLAACSEGDALRTNLALLRGLTAYELVNSIASAPQDRRPPAASREVIV